MALDDAVFQGEVKTKKKKSIIKGIRRASAISTIICTAANF